MGTYTEIHVVGSCASDHKAAAMLRYMFAEGEQPEEHPPKPNHEFFRLPRWRMVGHCSSHYLSPIALRDTYDFCGTLYFNSVSNLKNYDGEIEAFFDWLRTEGIEHYGHSRFEYEDECPVKLYRFNPDEAPE